jgi:hypothetical protein
MVGQLAVGWVAGVGMTWKFKLPNGACGTDCRLLGLIVLDVNVNMARKRGAGRVLR